MVGRRGTQGREFGVQAAPEGADFGRLGRGSESKRGWEGAKKASTMLSGGERRQECHRDWARRALLFLTLISFATSQGAQDHHTTSSEV